jgi:hypothetical protein
VEDNLPDNLDFMSSLEIAQNVFREILLESYRYEVELIEGDGNCFFRAVIRGLTPHVNQFDFDFFFSDFYVCVGSERF